MSGTGVSVIVPVYNRAGLVGATLASLLAQTKPADEIIVVDDGSEDESAAVAEAFGPPVRVIRISNSGPAKARNVGLAESRGDLVQFFDSDDLASDDYLEARLDALAGGGDIAYGPWLRISIDGTTINCDPFVHQVGPVSRPPIEAFLRSWVLLIQNTLIPRQLLERVGGYPDGLFTGEDVLLLWRLLRAGARLVHTDKSLLFLRKHPRTQISSAPEHAAQRLLDEFTLTQAILRDGKGLELPNNALKAFRTRHVQAILNMQNQGIISADGFDGVVSIPSLSERLIVKLDRITQRAAIRWRYERCGHRIPPEYAPARIAPYQLAKAVALGFMPVVNR